MFRAWWAGRLAIPLRLSKKPGKCQTCGDSTLWRTVGDPWKIIHPECAGLIRIGEDPAFVAELMANAIYNVAAGLGATLIALPQRESLRPIHIRQGPCSWCGQPGIGITADAYLHCRTHMWPPFR